MLGDIFSGFDPACSVFYGNVFYWAVSVVSVFVGVTSYWASFSRVSSFMSIFYSVMLALVDGNKVSKFSGAVIFLIPLLPFIVFLNLYGLVPYVFSITSHLFFSFALGFPLWLGVIISGLVYGHNKYLGGLVPMGVPQLFSPFLVVVETLSTSTRSFILAFRLTANMTMGHLVFCLLGGCFSSMMFSSIFWVLLVTFFMTFYLGFEVGVSFLQGYIFCLLLSLYVSEHPA